MEDGGRWRNWMNMKPFSNIIMRIVFEEVGSRFQILSWKSLIVKSGGSIMSCVFFSDMWQLDMNMQIYAAWNLIRMIRRAYIWDILWHWGFACEIVWRKVTTREIVPSGVLSCVDGAWRNPGGDVGLSKWKCVDCVQISQEGYTARLERSMPEVYFIERRQLGSTWRSTSYDIDRLVCKLNQWHHIVHQISQVSAHVVSSSVWKSWAKVCHCCTQPSILTLPVENAEHADIPSDRRNHDADTAVNFCPKGQQKLKRTLGSLGCSFGVYNTRNYNVKISETFSEIHEDWCRFEA